jgi:hypothetical protein
MRSIVRFVLMESVVTAIAAALISSVYIVVLPRYFHETRTYSVLVGGLAIAALVSGFVARTCWAPPQHVGWLLILTTSGAVTIATLLLTLLVILNTAGS